MEKRILLAWQNPPPPFLIFFLIFKLNKCRQGKLKIVEGKPSSHKAEINVIIPRRSTYEERRV